MNYLAVVLMILGGVALSAAPLHAQSPERGSPYYTVAGNDYIHTYPRQIVFWNVEQGSWRENTIFLRQGDEHPLAVRKVESTSEYVTAELVKSGGKERRTYSIRVRLSDAAPTGSMEGAIRILTDHPVSPEVTVPVFWNVLNGMVVDPPAFGVRLTRGVREAGGVIKIESSSGKPFEIEKVEAVFPGVTTDIKPMQSCCGYYIAVLVRDPQFHIRKSEESTLVIHTDSEQQKMVIVPLMVTAPVLGAPPSPAKTAP